MTTQTTTETDRLRYFYPGSIWAKRIARLMVVMAIGVNLFMNNLQDHVLHLIEERSHEIALIAAQIDVEKLRLDRIEEGSWTERSVDWLAYFMNSPKSNELNQFIDLSTETLEGYEDITKQLIGIDTGTELAMKVLHWTSLFMWIPILLSIVWLLIDVARSPARAFTILGLVLAIPVNFLSYELLVREVNMVLTVTGG